jgi:4-hydroxy-3-methylbut-2-enyl diphosphate reductase
MSLLLACAMRIEARFARQGVTDPSTTVHFAKIGVKTHLPAEIPQAAVGVSGVCGTLSAQLKPGSVVVPDVLLHKDGRRFYCTGASELARLLREAGLPVVQGMMLTTPKIELSKAQMARNAETGAIAVDMETATLFGEAGTKPFAAVRVVSDGVDASMFSPSILKRGYLALKHVRAATPALEEWARIVAS